jgi:hypothetical protein
MLGTSAANAGGRSEVSFPEQADEPGRERLDLSVGMFDWAKLRRTKGAIKLQRLVFADPAFRSQRTTPGSHPGPAHHKRLFKDLSLYAVWQMEGPIAAVEELDNCEVLRSFLPEGWEQKS